jgi:GNAT superfamily N-acetyltransferase
MDLVRLASADDAAEVARLLHDFNTEFDSPTPGPAVLEPRLRTLLAQETTLAWLGGDPAVAIALVTLRTNVWGDGPVGLLDELYVAPEFRGQGIGSELIAALLERARLDGWSLVEINVDEFDHDARRFYERHGFANKEPASDERALYYWLELT